MRQTVPYAVGVAISPVPIAAMLLLLTCRRAIVNGLSFAAGWTVGVAASALVFVVLVSRAGLTGSDPVWVALVEILLGVVFLAGAVTLWRRRSVGRGRREASWVAAVDALSARRSAGLGVVLSGANPKVLALSLGAALALVHSDVGATGRAHALLAFAVVGSVGVVAPLAVYVAAPARARSLLGRGRAWIERNERIVLVVLGVLLGLIFVRDGLASL